MRPIPGAAQWRDKAGAARGWGEPLVVLAVLAVLAVLGVSAWHGLSRLGGISYDYDEGVYWQSLESMRHGHRLFAEVFSSQPPAFLAGLSPVYNLLGGGIVAGRLPVLAGSLVALAAIFVVGRALADTWTGLLAMALMAFNPLYLDLSYRLQADMPSVIVGLVAVAIAAQARRNRSGRPTSGLAGSGWTTWGLAGVVLGLSVMTKLLGVVFVVPVAWLALSDPERRWQRLGATAVGLAVTGLAVVAPFFDQLSAVYLQAVGMHVTVRVSQPQSLGQTLGRVRGSYPALLPALIAPAGLLVGALRRVGWVGMLAAWLATAVGADLAQDPLYPHHLVVLLPPLCLLAGATPGLVVAATKPTGGGSSPDKKARRSLPASLATAAVVLLVLALAVVTVASPSAGIDLAAEPAISAISGHVQPGVYVVTDDLFAAAWTGHPVPPNLVDVSKKRISAGALTAADAENAINVTGARAVIFATGRLTALPGFPEWVSQRFSLVYDGGGGLQVWTRP